MIWSRNTSLVAASRWAEVVGVCREGGQDLLKVRYRGGMVVTDTADQFEADATSTFERGEPSAEVARRQAEVAAVVWARCQG